MGSADESRGRLVFTAFVLLIWGGLSVTNGAITTFTDPDFGNEVWRLTHDRAVRAEGNYHNIQCWSHDGRYTCYTLGLDSGGNYEVHVVDLMTGVDRLIDPGSGPRWAWQHNWLFYISAGQVIRYDADTETKLVVSSGVQHLGGVDSADTWLFGNLYYYYPTVEYTPVRMAADPPIPDQPYEILSAPSTHAWEILNPAHPVVEARHRSGDAVLGTRAILYDLDGTNVRTGIYAAEESHICWRGDGEYLLRGNSQAQGRLWNQACPSDLVMLANDDNQDVGPMDTTGRYICGTEIKLTDCRSGDQWEVLRVKSKIIFPADSGPSTFRDIDAKGSPDGTKIHYHACGEQENYTSLTVNSYDSSGGVVYVDSTDGWPSSGEFVYNVKEVIGYSAKTATSFTGIERTKYYSYYQSAFGAGSTIVPFSFYALDASEKTRAYPNYTIIGHS